MKVFLDSGNPREIRELLQKGFVFDGITTNPTTVSAYIREDGEDVYSTEMKIAELAEQYGQQWDISVETIGTPTEGEHAYSPRHLDWRRLEEEAWKIHRWHSLFTVKLPSTKEGFQATLALYRKEVVYGRQIPRNMTLGFSVIQGEHAARTGARYYSVFVGRYEDKGEDGMKVARDMGQHYSQSRYPTQLLVASVRKSEHIDASLEIRAPVITIPKRLVDQMIEKDSLDKTLKKLESVRNSVSEDVQPQTPPLPDKEFSEDMLSPLERLLLEEGLKRFLDDAARAGYKI